MVEPAGRLEAGRVRLLGWLAGVGLVLVAGWWLLGGGATEPIDSFATCATAGYAVTDSNPPVCRVGVRNLVGPLGSAAPSVAVVVSEPFDLLVTGDSRGSYLDRQEVIRSAGDWRRYWSQVHAGLPSLPPLIPVDFARQMVVAVSYGPKPTGGYGVKVADITTDGAGTMVDVTETMPAVGCVVVASPTNPYEMVQTASVPDPVSFRITVEKHGC